MNSYSYDSILAFDDDAFTYDIAGPSLSLYRELMDEEERLLEEEHNDCEDVELFSDAWLHRPASLLDELTAAGELDFFGETLSAETQDVSTAKEEDLLVKSVAGNDGPIVSCVAAKFVSRIPRLAGPVRSRITSPVKASRAAPTTTIPRPALKATTLPTQAKLLPAQTRGLQSKVVTPRGLSSTARGASITRPALKTTVAPAQYKVSSTSRPALRMTVVPAQVQAQASVQRKPPVSLANRTSLAPQKKRTDRA